MHWRVDSYGIELKKGRSLKLEKVADEALQQIKGNILCYDLETFKKHQKDKMEIKIESLSKAKHCRATLIKKIKKISPKAAAEQKLHYNDYQGHD